MLVAADRSPVGLSPRTRGSRLAQLGHELLGGPIPADAGEPRALDINAHGPGAYPRGRGGAKNVAAEVGRMKGLSPRTRGSPLCPDGTTVLEGPIPADAGGAYVAELRAKGYVGLSPRTRGSHHRSS